MAVLRLLRMLPHLLLRPVARPRRRGVPGWPLTAARPSDSRGLLAFARASAERDARAPYPDTEIGRTALPFEQILAGHCAARLDRLGRGFAHAAARAGRQVDRAAATVRERQMVERDACRRELAAAAAFDAARTELRCSGGSQRSFASSAWTPLVRLVVLAVVTCAEAVALKPTLDGLGASKRDTYLLVAAIVLAGLLLAGHLARHGKDLRIAADDLARTDPTAVSEPFLSAAVTGALGLLAVANVVLAVVRAEAYVGELSTLGAVGDIFNVGVLVAFLLFLSLQALFTAAAAAVEFHAHDPLAAGVRRLGTHRSLARRELRRARQRVVAAAAELRAAVGEGTATVEAFVALAREERAWAEIVRDSYRADLVARCPLERAAALAAAPRSPWPLPQWLGETEPTVKRLLAALPAAEQAEMSTIGLGSTAGLGLPARGTDQSR
ncbi:hypothetical protein [Frankia tisae]|uniref:hypothetical protein n=1 Tax=Frankia tisae TaxID=2950104 RepID=UPI0021BFC622|nr:hypothetical protein [Frankia tisae]